MAWLDGASAGSRCFFGFIADFYCHDARLVVEVDGGIHAAQVEYDVARDELFRAHHLRILRLSNDEVLQDVTSVLARIAAACRVDLTPGPSPAGEG